MELSDVFAIISMVFLISMVFFIFKKPPLIQKVDAILISLLGSLFYAILCVDYYTEVLDISPVFGIICAIFFVAIIFFSVNKPKLVTKGQAISLSIFGFLIYGALWGACYIK